jgi:hypothetical protein
MEQILKTSLLPQPTSSVAVPTSLPSIVPDPIEYQKISAPGKQTLWVVFVIMTISSAAFAFLSWRVPLVRLKLYT